jgi:protein ImuB
MFACIYVPDFPVEAMVRAEPLLRDRAVAVLEGRPPLTRVIAVNEKARLLGMEIGMTKLQAAVFAGTLPSETAKAQVPQRGSKRANTSSHSNLAILRQRSPQQEISAHAALLDVAHAFTPRVEDTAPDTLLLDLEGLDRLYGAPPRMASELAARVMAVGIEANIAVAANPDAAMHAARGFNGTTVIPGGKEAQRLGVLPLQVLLDAFEISSQKKAAGKAPERGREKLREQMLDTLERWGVRDFRALALLPEHALVSRLGEAGAQLRRLARGEGMRTLVLCAPQSQFEEAMELESPVETIESYRSS